MPRMTDNDLISRSALAAALEEDSALMAQRAKNADAGFLAVQAGITLAMAALNAAPTIDPVRHARWEAVNEHCNHASVFRCSGRDGCGASVDYGHYTRFCDYEWCPNCGARMDEEVQDEQ